MITTCEICDAKIDILDGYPKAEQWKKGFEEKHCINATIEIEIEAARKPIIRIPAGMEMRAFEHWMARQGMHMPSTQRIADHEIRIPRGGRCTWQQIAERMRAQGINIKISQKYKTDPDGIHCTHSCTNAKISHEYCRCTCGGHNHAARQIGNWIRHFHCTITNEPISPFEMMRRIWMPGIQTGERTLHDAMAH